MTEPRSFSVSVKDELCGARVTSSRDEGLELGMALLTAGRRRKDQILLSGTHQATSERFKLAFVNTMNIDAEMSCGHGLLTLQVTAPHDIATVDYYLRQIFSYNAVTGQFLRDPGFDPSDQIACMRGHFLAAGSIADPERAYHLELNTRDEVIRDFALEMLRARGLETISLERTGSFVIYIKDGQGISDYLTLLNASRSMLNFESLRVEKDMRNQVNRVVNCDSANADRIADTAARQVADFTWYDEHYGLGKLPPDLRAAAEARLAYPEFSLAELGASLDPPLSKSGINHRFRKLNKLIQDQREGRA